MNKTTTFWGKVDGEWVAVYPSNSFANPRDETATYRVLNPDVKPSDQRVVTLHRSEVKQSINPPVHGL